MTNLLTPSKAKKGLKVFKVSAWNFHLNCPRKDQHSRDERGRSVYTPHTVDQYCISEYTVHSAGPNQMHLCDENGMRGERTSCYQGDDKFYGFFLLTKEDAVAFVHELDANDPHSIGNVEIIYKNY